MSKITIVGAGATGATLALFLRNEGHEVSLYDGRPDSRQISGPAYRTIAVTLSERGLGVFRRLNLENRVLEQSMAVTGRMMHSRTGADFPQAYSVRGDRLQCVARIDLDQLLLDAVERAGDITMHFLHECTHIDVENNRLTFKDKHSGQLKLSKATTLSAADGATSPIRAKLVKLGVVKAETINFSGATRISDPGRQERRLDPRSGLRAYMAARRVYLIAFPALKGEFIAMLFMPAAGAGTNEGDERERIQRTSPIWTRSHRMWPIVAKQQRWSPCAASAAIRGRTPNA